MSECTCRNRVTDLCIACQRQIDDYVDWLEDIAGDCPWEP